jgi:hypothetical protein
VKLSVCSLSITYLFSSEGPFISINLRYPHLIKLEPYLEKLNHVISDSGVLMKSCLLTIQTLPS